MDTCSTNQCSYGNDNPYRMDMPVMQAPLTILYLIAKNRVWGYVFSQFFLGSDVFTSQV